MSPPFIFITEHTVKGGRLKDLERLTDEFLEFVEANEPRLLAINAYLNDDRDRLTLVQIHADGDSMESHLQIAGDKITRRQMSSRTTASPSSVRRGGSRAELLDQIWTVGVRVTVNSSQLGGFHRLTAV